MAVPTFTRESTPSRVRAQIAALPSLVTENVDVGAPAPSCTVHMPTLPPADATHNRTKVAASICKSDGRWGQVSRSNHVAAGQRVSALLTQGRAFADTTAVRPLAVGVNRALDRTRSRVTPASRDPHRRARVTTVVTASRVGRSRKYRVVLVSVPAVRSSSQHLSNQGY